MMQEIHPPITTGECVRYPYNWLKDDDVHWTYSALLGKDTTKKADKLIRFMIRARRGLFADKQSRLARQGAEYWLRRYGGVQVDDDRCDRCGSTETRYHFCECEAANDIRQAVTTKIKHLINSHIQDRNVIDDIPCFWAREQRHTSHTSDLWQKIESRQTELSAMGIIPRSFIKFLESLKWRPQTDLRKIVAQIQLFIVQGHFDAWTERCKVFTEKHTKRVQIRRRADKVRTREELRTERRRQHQLRLQGRADQERSRNRPPKRRRTATTRIPPQEEPPP